MSHAVQTISKLSTESRERLEAWLLEFDRHWKPGRMTQCAADVPAEMAPFEAVYLLELAKVDLDRQWSDGNRVAVEEYLRDFPRLGTPQTVSAELLLAEYIARKAVGERDVSQDLVRRFPDRAADLKRLLQRELQDGSLAGRVRQSRDTTTGKSDTQSVAPRDEAAEPRRPPIVREPAGGEEMLPADFGRYKILRQLGRGAMGAVYLAEDTQLRRKVALKTPSFTRGKSAGLVERFQREARAAANLRNANICPVYDVGEIDGVQFITMAYIDGHTLSGFIKPGKPIAERVAASLIRKLALGLQHAHAAGVIHRDLKPANIMIDRQKEPIIMDFGLARQLGNRDESRVTQEGTILGTPAYMSPEQVAGDLDAGPRADVYSLGVILFELLTGRLPFEGTVTAVIGQIASQDPPRPSAFRPDLDPAMEAICRKMMARKPDDRYGEMRDAAAALTDYLKQTRAETTPAETDRGAAARTVGDESGLQALFEVVETQPPSLVGHPLLAGKLTTAAKPAAGSRWKAIPRVWKWSAFGVLAALIVWSVVLIVRRSDGSTLRIEVDDPNLVVSLDGDRLTLTDKTWEGKKKAEKHKLAVKVGAQQLTIGSPTVVELPDGRSVTHKLALQLNGAELRSNSFELVRGGTAVVKISYTKTTSALSKEDPFAGRLELPAARKDGPVQILTGHSGTVTSVSFSRDGRFAISSSQDKTVRYWDLTTGKLLKTFTGHPGRVSRVALAPNGKFALSCGNTGSLLRWNLDGSTPPKPFVGHQKYVRSVSINPAGTHAISGGDFGELFRWDLRSEIGTPLKGIGNDSTFATAYSENGKFAVTGGYRKTPILWNAADMTIRKNLPTTSDPINTASVSNDGRWVLVGSGWGKGHMTQLIDAENGTVVFRRHDANQSTMTRDGSRGLTSAAKSGFVTLLDLKAKRDIGQIQTPFKRVTCLAFSSDERYALFGGDDGRIALWLLPNRAIATIPDFGPVDVLALIPRLEPQLISPDGKRLLKVQSGSPVGVDYAPPEEYDLQVTLRRFEIKNKKDDRGFTVSLPVGVGTRICNVYIDGQFGFGIANLDGKGYRQNETSIRRSGRNSRLIKPGRQHRIVYRVRKASITVEFNGRKIIDWKGRFERLSSTRDGKRRIGFGAHKARFVVLDAIATPYRAGKSKSPISPKS